MRSERSTYCVLAEWNEAGLHLMWQTRGVAVYEGAKMAPLAQMVRFLSFETWCRNHDEDHRARWCRELYPWEVFAAGDYRDGAIGHPQDVDGFRLTVTGKEHGKVEGRTQFHITLETPSGSNAETWRRGRWSDDFTLVTANDGHFITLFSNREDPAKNALMDFMTGRFDRLDPKRCLPWSALLFRTLVAEIAGSLSKWDRGVHYSVQARSVRPDDHKHLKFRPDGAPIRPFLSTGRRWWVMYAFTEEKAQRQALYCEGQCDRLTVVYCQPTLTRHHRSRSPATEVISLFQLAKAAGRARDLLPQIRFLTNHMHAPAVGEVAATSLADATAALQRAAGPQEIMTSDLREARSAMGIEVNTVGEAAYAFAAANLLNAVSNQRAGLYRGSLRILKEVYAFKQRVAHWIEGLIDEPVPGVTMYVTPPGRNDVVYVRVGEVQFSFHAVARTPKIVKFGASTANVEQEWSGMRLQQIAPSVLAWGRAMFRSEV